MAATVALKSLQVTRGVKILVNRASYSVGENTKNLTSELSTLYKLWTLPVKMPIKNMRKNIHNKLYIIEI